MNDEYAKLLNLISDIFISVCGRSLNARKASTALVKGADARLWEVNQGLL